MTQPPPDFPAAHPSLFCSLALRNHNLTTQPSLFYPRSPRLTRCARTEKWKKKKEEKKRKKKKKKRGEKEKKKEKRRKEREKKKKEKEADREVVGVGLSTHSADTNSIARVEGLV
mmetsp:Transcript_33690/g.79536  ORF Transcript_33690/g.79536 Transcript_33690/m.79536 type:complete len:115 (-) Transcript_33690:106-450(-)